MSQLVSTAGDPQLQRFYRRKLIQKGLGEARVAVARKLGIRLWIMLRDQIDANEFCRRGQMRQKNDDACAGMPDTAYGAKQSPAPSDLGYPPPPVIWKCAFTRAEPLWASLAAYAADRLSVVVDFGVGPWDP